MKKKEDGKMNQRKRVLSIAITLCTGLLLSACTNANKQESSIPTTVNQTTEATAQHTTTLLPNKEAPTVTAPPSKAATDTPTISPTALPVQEAYAPVPHSNTVIKDGSFLYYKDGTYTHGDHNSTCQLVVEDTNSGDKKVLTTFAAEEFYLYGDYLYYADRSDIYRIGTDGRGKTRIYNGNAADASILGISGQYLYFYFSMEGQVFRVNIKGSQRKLLAQNAAEVKLLGERIYYTVKGINDMTDLDSTDRLFSMATDGTDKKELHTSYDLYDLVSNADGVYFIDLPEKESSQAYLSKLDSVGAVTRLCTVSQKELSKKGAITLDSHTLRLYFATNRTLYYSIAYQAAPNTELYSIDCNGDNHMLLLNIHDLKDINETGYLSKVRFDENHLLMTIDCDDTASQTYLVALSNSHASKAESDAYLNTSLDILGDEVFAAKRSTPSSSGSYGDYTYQRFLLSDFLK